MLVIPAIDLRAGQCVRLEQGRAEAQTVYATDPVAVAREFAAAGAQLIHVVDLDGAFAGHPVNLGSIAAIAAAVPIPIEVGGGIRTPEALAQVLSAGASRVILGTTAISDPDFVRAACRAYPGRIVAGIDARAGFVATRGWVETTTVKASELARRLEEVGVSALIYTDISRDGMLSGPNLEAQAAFLAATALPVIASGGVGQVADLVALAHLEVGGRRLAGAIVGKALYTGAVDLAMAIAAVAEECSGGEEKGGAERDFPS